MHKILFYNKFIICFYMFLAQCAHHQEAKVVLYIIWYRHTCRWPFGAPARFSKKKVSERKTGVLIFCATFVIVRRYDKKCILVFT